MTRSRGVYERHGMNGTKTYNVWHSMRARCANPRNAAFKDYGGRGIAVCERWLKFSGFFEDMGAAPEGGTLDRIDNNKGYSPDNCRWATPTEQGRNKRNNILITIGEETLPLSAWIERTGVSYGTAHQRIRIGWPPHLAVTTPLVKDRKGVPRGLRAASWSAEPEYADLRKDIEQIERERPKKAFCAQGHELSGANVRMRGNTRNCIECVRLGNIRYRARKVAEKALANGVSCDAAP